MKSSDVLEVLQAAEIRLMNGADYDFRDWTQCASGHIYAAAVGRKAARDEHVEIPSNHRFVGVIMATAKALGWNEAVGAEVRELIEWIEDCGPRHTPLLGVLATEWVSQMVGKAGEDPASALRVIRRAMAVIQSEQDARSRPLVATVEP